MKKLGTVSLCLFALVAASLGLATPARAASTAPPITTHVDRYLAGRLQTVSSTATMRVVVNADTLDHAVAASRAAGVRPVVRMARLGVVVGAGTPAAVRKLVGQRGVEWLGDADQPLALHLDSSHRATRAAQAATAFTAPGGGAYDGSGIGIMIIDGGIDASHPMFMRNGVSKVRRNLETIPFGDLISPLPIGEGADGYGLLIDMPIEDSDDIAGHGDHVASIAAGYPVTTEAGHPLVGAAPGASLYGISVATANSTYYGALAAQYWTLLNHAAPCGTGASNCPPIRVVNNSYGPIGGGAYDPASPTNEAMRLSIAEGVTWVWSAGNDGGDGSADVTGPSAKEPTPGVLSVANYDDGNAGLRDNHLDASSSRGAQADPATWPDISAPGTDIEAACRLQYTLCLPDLLSDLDLNYGRMTGTSMAAPHIAGYVAVLLSANPALTPAQIENVLEDTAYKFTAGAGYASDPTNADNSSSFDKGHGLVDVTAALASVLGVPNLPPAVYCAATSSATDPTGDATDVGIDGILPATLPGNSDPNVDITQAGVSLAGANVRFSVHVADLGDQPSAGSSGDYVRYRFSINGTTYELVLQRDVGANGPPTESFSLATQTVDANGLPASEPVDTTITGHFDPATNEAWAEVPASAIGAAAGDQLTGVEVLWQRQVTNLTLTADTVRSACPFSI
jgi:serine protease AprX